MITITLLILGAAALEGLARQRDDALACLAIVLVVLIPSQVAQATVPFMHPVGYLLLVHLVTLLWRQDAWTLYLLNRYLPLLLATATISGYAFLDVLGGHSALVQTTAALTQILWLPLGLFFLVARALARRSGGSTLVLATALALGVVQVVLAHVQVTSGGDRGYLWETFYARSWFWSQDASFAMGTTGHPLQLSLFLAQLVLLLARVPNLWLRYALAVTFLYGITLATGRTALVLALAGLGYVVVTSARRVQNLGFASLGALALSFLLSRGGGAGIMEKIQHDQGSSELRRYALAWSLEHFREFLLFGYPGHRDLRTAGTLGSSLENAYLMVGLEFGLVVAGALVLLHLALVLVVARRPVRGSTPFVLAALVSVVGFNASSSFMGGAIECFTFCWFLGVAAGSRLRQEALPAVTSGAPAGMGALR